MIPANKEMNDIGKSAAAAKRDLRDAWDKTADARENLEETAHKAGRKVRNYIDGASEELSHAADTVGEHIRSKPLQSSLIALAAGFVLAKIFRL